VRCAAKEIRLSAKMKNEATENSFGIFLEHGIGAHKDLSLAGQYYLRSAQQDHPDGANDCGFGLGYARGVKQNVACRLNIINSSWIAVIPR
jgi:TPR repeat protein